MRDYYSVFNNELVGNRVFISNKILKRKSQQYRELYGKEGVIRSVWEDNICVEIDGVTNTQSKQGLFYFDINELLIDNNGDNSMTNENFDNYRGNYTVTKIHFVDDVSNKEVFARLYDDGMVYEVDGYVVAKTVNKYMRVAKIIEIS